MFKIWIDEAGRWPWLWPVVACSLTFDLNNLPNSKFLGELNDSKKLTHKKREKLFLELVRLSNIEKPQVYFWVWVVDNFVIDDINIRQANKEAMRRSLVEILRKIDNSKILSVSVDGNDNYIFDELEKNPIYIIGWDAKVLEISAASIIAKVFRDKLIDVYWLLYPDLWIENHKWYGTKKHMNYLSDISKITWVHRISYKPIKKILEAK